MHVEWMLWIGIKQGVLEHIKLSRYTAQNTAIYLNYSPVRSEVQRVRTVLIQIQVVQSKS